jgi:hypothetical protein
MTAPVFPFLPGLTYPIARGVGQFNTTKHVVVSGKETRFANRTQARYQYSLDVSGLDSAGLFPGLGAQSKQALEGLFLATLGGALIFNYYDPDDGFVSGQPFGTGDGATTAFQLYRSTPTGWNDAVYAPLIAASSQLLAGAGAQFYAPHNLIAYSGDLTQAAWSRSNVTVAGGVADPFGGVGAQTVTATAANAFIDQFATATGANYVSSLWARRRAGSGLVKLADPGHDGATTTLALTSSWQRFWIAGPPASGHVSSLLNLATSGDEVDVYGAQIEQSLIATPGPYLATGAVPSNGSPLIYVNGALPGAGSYSLSASGVVTFNSPPANGAALTWTGSYYWPCNFDADTLALSNDMGGLWSAKAVKFTTRVY